MLLFWVIVYFLFSGLTSCKSSKHVDCDAYGDIKILNTDSTLVKIEHCHIDKEHYCYYSIDTLKK